MLKGIAVHAVFLIGVIAISLFFIIAIFWGWIDTTKFTTSQASCKASLISYCSALNSGTRPSSEWNDGCTEYKIFKPDSIDSCCEQGFISSKCRN